jgi:hypothetical protein
MRLFRSASSHYPSFTTAVMLTSLVSRRWLKFCAVPDWASHSECDHAPDLWKRP